MNTACQENTNSLNHRGRQELGDRSQENTSKLKHRGIAAEGYTAFIITKFEWPLKTFKFQMSIN